MIGWGDVYKVVEAMFPLYAALAMGYGSVRWWRVFTPDQSEPIYKLVSSFILPMFTFELTLHTDPFAMNLRLIAADTITKVVIATVLLAWAKFSPKGSYGWSITGFSLSNLTSSLVVGVPMLKAMYGMKGQDLVVQLSVVQAVVWLTLLLFVMEVRKTSTDQLVAADTTSLPDHAVSIDKAVGVDLESNDNTNGCKGLEQEDVRKRPSVWSIMKKVLMKLAINPNSYACFLGISWALIANRWHFKMPMIMEGCVLIISKSGTGMAMFSMGLFMALQEKMISCGPSLTVYGMALKFVAGPLAMAIGSIVVGLRGDVLRIAIIQAALPQSITSFIFAREYDLHVDVLSTVVVLGMLVSLPVLVAYYIALELLH